MTFLSYAQNFEDVMLWRALKSVEKGFYIDVGANDPIKDSVTKAFYDRGWRGINIEPLKSHHQDLIQARPNDINLLCAAGAVSGQVDMWECDVRGWATASSDVIQKHEQGGVAGTLHSVPIFPLKDICEEYVQGEIHFLKIDVEGFEKDVLTGMNFKKFRPWIVVVEATKPNSTEEIHEDWEVLIVSNDYVFAYADGLNRFYLSTEQAPNLLVALRYPPNVFDDFIQLKQYESEIRAQEAEIKAQQAQALGADANAQLYAVYNSTSWRITKLLRIAKTVLKTFIGKVLRLVMRESEVLVRRFPITKRVTIWILNRAPFLMRLVTRFSENQFLVRGKIKKRIYKFDQLGAARIMFALSKLPEHTREDSVTFLEVRDDVS